MSDTILLTQGADLHVFAVDLPMEQANALLGDPASLARSLGIATLDTARAEIFAAETFLHIGVSGYLTDGQGAATNAVLPDEPMLDALTGPILLLLPGALARDVRSLTVMSPLRHLASYPGETGAPAMPPEHTPSADSQSTLTAQQRKRADRKASGYVAVAALLVLFLIVAIMVWIA